MQIPISESARRRNSPPKEHIWKSYVRTPYTMWVQFLRPHSNQWGLDRRWSRPSCARNSVAPHVPSAASDLQPPAALPAHRYKEWCKANSIFSDELGSNISKKSCYAGYTVPMILQNDSIQSGRSQFLSAMIFYGHTVHVTAIQYIHITCLSLSISLSLHIYICIYNIYYSICIYTYYNGLRGPCDFWNLTLLVYAASELPQSQATTAQKL